MEKGNCSVGLAVEAKYNGAILHGCVVSCERQRALVEMGDRRRWRFPYRLLERSDRQEGAGYWSRICPIDSRVGFASSGGRKEGIVIALKAQHARVKCPDSEWRVPYADLNVITAPTVAWELTDILGHGHKLMRRHGLDDWTFTFDFAAKRGGVCNYAEKRVSLSVTYCHRESRDGILDTILHEIAHALVGPGHGHDRIWKAKAREIGCSADVRHRVVHTHSRWIGACGCGPKWKRNRLARNMHRAQCRKCRGTIAWTRNSEFKELADSRENPSHPIE